MKTNSEVSGGDDANELFSIVDGQKVDADLHAQFLGEVDPSFVRAESYEVVGRAIAAGVDEDVARRLFMQPGDTSPGSGDDDTDASDEDVNNLFHPSLTGRG